MLLLLAFASLSSVRDIRPCITASSLRTVARSEPHAFNRIPAVYCSVVVDSIYQVVVCGRPIAVRPCVPFGAAGPTANHRILVEWHRLPERPLYPIRRDRSRRDLSRLKKLFGQIARSRATADNHLKLSCGLNIGYLASVKSWMWLKQPFRQTDCP